MTPALVGALPLFVVAAWALLGVVLDALGGRTSRGWTRHVALVGLGLGAVASAAAWPSAAGSLALFHGMIVTDRFALVVDGIVLVAAALCLLLMAPGPARGAAEEPDALPGEAPPLLLFSVAGMMMLARAGDLVTVLLGIETMSLPLYVLAGLDGGPRGAEAALKYFVLGAFATGFLVYGIALLYGATGSTSLATVGEAAADHVTDPLYLAGMLLLLVAFAFKVAAVPFHMWAPDVYEGAPTPVTAFMAAAVKTAGFAALLRVLDGLFARPEFVYGPPGRPTGWANVLAWLAALTMIVGNLAALRQESVKRMLAWSSVAHAGYVLVAVVASGVAGGAARTAALYYLAAYTFMTIGAFGLCAHLGATRLDDWAGMSVRRPAAALAMTLFLLSLGGIPPTAGFFGKLLVFQAALEEPQLLPLVLTGVLTSVVAVYYYLRVVVAMYLREPAAEAPDPPRRAASAVALTIAAIVVLQLGLFPGALLDLLARL